MCIYNINAICLSVFTALLRLLFYWPKQILYLNIQTFGNLHQCLDIWLYGVGTPLRYGCRIFTQLFSEPFVGSFLFSQDDL